MFTSLLEEFELVVGSTDIDTVGEGDVIVVEVISFGDEEAVTSIMPSCSDVELVRSYIYLSCSWS